MMMIHRDELITLLLLREDAEGVDDDVVSFGMRSEVEINQKRKVARPFLSGSCLGCTRIFVRKLVVLVYIISKYWVSTSSRKSISSFTLILSHTHTPFSLFLGIRSSRNSLLLLNSHGLQSFL